MLKMILITGLLAGVLPASGPALYRPLGRRYTGLWAGHQPMACARRTARVDLGEPVKATCERIPCVGCGALVPDIDGPTHDDLDVFRAKDLAGHEAAVRRWARSAWEAWSPHHDTVGRWAEAHGG